MWNWAGADPAGVNGQRGNAQRMEWVYFQVGSTTSLIMKDSNTDYYYKNYGLDTSYTDKRNLPRWIATVENSRSGGIKMSYGDVRTLMNNLYGIKSVSWLETNRRKATRPYEQANKYLTNSHTYSLFESLSGAANGLFETYDVGNAGNLTIFEYVDLCENTACLKSSTQNENGSRIEFWHYKSTSVTASSYTGSIYTVSNQFEITKLPYGARYSFNGFTPVAIPAEYTGTFVYSHVNLAKLTCYMGYYAMSDIVEALAGAAGENDNLVAYRYW